MQISDQILTYINIQASRYKTGYNLFCMLNNVPALCPQQTCDGLLRADAPALQWQNSANLLNRIS